jgi:CheY-like chemotaxis protein
VLDDKEVICELVDCTLTPLGYTVVQTYDAATMLQRYEEAFKEGHPFDLVMMDLTIPGGMGGKEAIHELKKIDPTAKAIVSSGYGMDPIMTRSKDFGFCGSISKPFDLTQLEQSVQDALSS